MKFSLFIFCFTLSLSAHAITLKLALLPPEGTNWAGQLQKMSQEVKAATQNEVELKIYAGGVAGDELDVLRKIRVGQFHGGLFTARTLGDVYGDVRVIELPFSFKQDRQRAWRTLQKFAPQFDQGLAQAGLKNLGYIELGNIYLVTMKKVSSMADLKGIKIWSWEGDPMVAGLFESLQLIPVQLSLPDVLPSLTTGIIDAAYASPSGLIALQWQSKIKYLVDFPVAFSVGAVLLSDKAWGQIPKKHQATVESIAKKYISLANLQTIQENEEALASLKKTGVEFIHFSVQDLKKGDDIHVDVSRKLTGPMISPKTINAFNQAVKNI